MCDLDTGFKLCTCDPDEVDSPDWELQRRDRTLPPERRRGRAARPHFSADDQERIQLVLGALEAGEAFDFEGPFEDGDVLVLFGYRADGGDLRFRVDDGAWELDRSTSLTSWRTQMRSHRAGKVA